MARCLIIGSVAWDEVVQLQAPLRRGAHNQGLSVGKRIGGSAANTAMALLRAGDQPCLVSALGADAEGQALLAALQAQGLDTTQIDRNADQTTQSLVLIETDGERTIVNRARARVPIPADLAQGPADCLYICSADPALTPVLAQRVETGLVVAHLPPLTVGSRPAQVLVGSRSDLDKSFLDQPFEAGRQVAGDPLQWVVVTDGPGGAVAYGKDQTLHQKSAPVAVVDTTGAGDAFAAGLIHALSRNQPMATALKTAVAWGSASVTYKGTIPPAEFPG